MEMWILNKKESCGVRGSCLLRFWEVHWRSRIRGRKLSSWLPCSPLLFLLCSGIEALGSVLRHWLLALLQLGWVKILLLHPGSDQSLDLWPQAGAWVGGTRAVCSLTLQAAPKLKSLSSYSSQESLEHTQLESPLRKDGAPLNHRHFKDAASLQTSATLLHTTAVRKCKIHLPRFNPLHLSFPRSRAVTSTRNSFP